jgi:hypothetical protein
MKIPVIILSIFAMAVFLAGCNNQPAGNQLTVVNKALPDSNIYKNTILEKAFNKLQAGDSLSTQVIEDFSGDIGTRADFFGLLSRFNKGKLFPTKYYNFESAAESALSNWLEYPTELDTIPSTIAFIKKVDITENETTFIYYVFQFKTEEPHWAAKEGWMMGVVGPYFRTSRPYDWTSGTFSRLTKINDITPEKEVDWVHNNVFKKSPD